MPNPAGPEAARTATTLHARPNRWAERLAFSRVGVAKRCTHGVDRNCRYDAREKEPTDTNPDRKCARERLPRHHIAITNREAGDEGEIQCVPDRPALDKTSQQAQGNLNS